MASRREARAKAKAAREKSRAKAKTAKSRQRQKVEERQAEPVRVAPAPTPVQATTGGGFGGAPGVVESYAPGAVPPTALPPAIPSNPVAARRAARDIPPTGRDWLQAGGQSQSGQMGRALQPVQPPQPVPTAPPTNVAPAIGPATTGGGFGGGAGTTESYMAGEVPPPNPLAQPTSGEALTMTPDNRVSGSLANPPSGAKKAATPVVTGGEVTSDVGAPPGPRKPAADDGYKPYHLQYTQNQSAQDFVSNYLSPKTQQLAETPGFKGFLSRIFKTDQAGSKSAEARFRKTQPGGVHTDF